MQDSKPAATSRQSEPPAWRVVVCTGPRCSANRSAGLASLLRQRLGEAGLSDRIALGEAAGICHHRCGVGPNLFITPGDSWYCGVTPPDLDDIVNDHLVAGQPVTRLLGKEPSFLRLNEPLPW